MPRKRGADYENEKPGIGFNTILKDERYGWRKKNCVRRHCDEWLKERKAFTDNNRPSINNIDEGWERKCFDFFEPFYLSGCIDNLKGGKKILAAGAHGAQVDIMFHFIGLDKDFTKTEKYIGVCEAKINSEHYERALSQLREREIEIAKFCDDEKYIPIVIFKGDRQPIKFPSDVSLIDIHQRTLQIWENDLDFYISQVVDLGWKKTWKLFLLEVLNIRAGSLEEAVLPALKFKIKGEPAFSLYMPSDLALDICHVERARKNAPHGVYQRALEPKRIKEIAEDLKNPHSLNTCFPNSLVASFDPIIFNKLSSIWESTSEHMNVGNVETGLLRLPNIYGLIKIIDGQHRLFAHDLLPEELKSAYGLPFTIMSDLSTNEEMILFKSINTTAEEVNENLVDIILYLMKDEVTDRGLASSIICMLAFEDEEWIQFFGHLGTRIADYDFGKKGIKIKIHNLVQSLLSYDLIKENNKGLLNPEFNKDKVTYASNILKQYLELLKERFSNAKIDYWDDYIRTRPGIRLMMLTLAQWIKKKNLRGNPVDDMKLPQLVEKIFQTRMIIKNRFDDTRGSGRGDEFLREITNDILNK